MTGCSINKSLTNFYCNIFWTTSAAEFVGIIFRSLFQYITVVANFQKNLVCDTSYIEINAFFAIFNNKESENFKVRPSYSILKKWKSDCFKKYPLLKFLFWKSSCSEEVCAWKKYMVWIITYSEEKAPPKHHLRWRSNYLQQIADKKSICYQEVVIRKK